MTRHGIKDQQLVGNAERTDVAPLMFALKPTGLAERFSGRPKSLMWPAINSRYRRDQALLRHKCIEFASRESTAGFMNSACNCRCGCRRPGNGRPYLIVHKGA